MITKIILSAYPVYKGCYAVVCTCKHNTPLNAMNRRDTSLDFPGPKDGPPVRTAHGCAQGTTVHKGNVPLHDRDANLARNKLI